MKQNIAIKTETFKTIFIFAASLSLTQCAQVPTLLDADGDGKPDGIDLDEDGEIDEPLYGKVLLCHNDNNPHTISISPNAVDAHLRNHDDCLGACPCE